MQAERHSGSVWRDERAQTITEFAVIIPLVLFMFLAMIQYVMAAQTAQAGNYAAYAASRAYCVNVQGGSQAARKAQIAAAMAYAPLSTPFNGEWTARSVGNPLGAARALLTSVSGVTQPYADRILAMQDSKVSLGAARVIYGAPEPAMDLTMAWGRLGFLCGGLEVHQPPPKTEDNKTTRLFQNTIVLTYRLPLWIAGFREMWNYMRWGRLEDEYAEEVGGYPTMPVRSACAMGIEEWSGCIALAGSGGVPAAGPPSSHEGEADAGQAAAAEVKAALDELQAATRALQQAQAALAGCEEDCEDEQQAVANAQERLDNAQERYDAAMAALPGR